MMPGMREQEKNRVKKRKQRTKGKERVTTDDEDAEEILGTGSCLWFHHPL